MPEELDALNHIGIPAEAILEEVRKGYEDAKGRSHADAGERGAQYLIAASLAVIAGGMLASKAQLTNGYPEDKQDAPKLDSNDSMNTLPGPDYASESPYDKFMRENNNPDIVTVYGDGSYGANVNTAPDPSPEPINEAANDDNAGNQAGPDEPAPDALNPPPGTEDSSLSDDPKAQEREAARASLAKETKPPIDGSSSVTVSQEDANKTTGQIPVPTLPPSELDEVTDKAVQDAVKENLGA
jgi:hypothetical protein